MMEPFFASSYRWGAIQGKTCQDLLLSRGGRSVWAQISGRRGRLWGIFFGFYKTRHIFAIWQCKLHRATCRRFNTIPACDRRTDGRTDGRTARQTDRQTDRIAVASTAVAMRALRRAVKRWYYSAAHRHIVNVLTSNITFLIFYETTDPCPLCLDQRDINIPFTATHGCCRSRNG